MDQAPSVKLQLHHTEVKMLPPRVAWKKISNKFSSALKYHKISKESSQEEMKDSSQNFQTEDFDDDDVFEVDEEISSGAVQDDFFTNRDFRTRSSFRALLLKTYSIPSYMRWREGISI